MITMLIAAATAVTPPLLDTRVAADGERIASVRFADLDLASERDRRRLERRIDSAIHRMCSTWGRVSLSENAEAARCRNVARRSALTGYADAVASQGRQTKRLAEAGAIDVVQAR